MAKSVPVVCFVCGVLHAVSLLLHCMPRVMPQEEIVKSVRKMSRRMSGAESVGRRPLCSALPYCALATAPHK